MRRAKTLVARSGGISLQVSIKIDTKGLSMWEATLLMEDVVDRIMRGLPETRYMKPSLHKIKVK